VNLKSGRLQTRIARYIAFAVVASLVLSLLVLVVFRHRFLQRNMENSAHTFVLLVSERLVDQVEFLGIEGRNILEQEVAELRRLNPDIERLEVVDVRGRVLLLGDEGNVTVYGSGGNSPVVTDPELVRALSGLETTAARVTGIDGRRRYRVVDPVVTKWGGHHYSLIGTFSYENVDRQLRSSLWLSTLIIAIGLGLTRWASVRLAEGIMKGVDRLREGVRRLREGHLKERVSVSSGDEIEELADGFNLMADELLATIERLRNANRELETLDQTKADLVANVSHELKTPLTALRGYLELIADGGLGEVPDDAQRAVAICRKNVQRLALRVEELVQLAHLDRFTALDSPRERVNLGRLLDASVETFQPRVEERGIEVVLHVEPGLRPLEANVEQLERVFLNLLDNAVKFTRGEGTVFVTAESCSHEDLDGVLVKVQDNGVGIPQSEIMRIFDRFHQVDPSSRRRFGGMGLGLSLVRSIVEAHSGVVWAESEPDVGSTFSVWLPTVSADPVPGGVPGPSAKVGHAGDLYQAEEEV
jgi:signal transduction histidine kinase